MKYLGFTGTQKGMTGWQKEQLSIHMNYYRPKYLVHGDCVGADAEAHELALMFAIGTVIHPPVNPKKRAFCKHYDFMMVESDYMTRNKAIVNQCEMLVAAPKSKKEELRSGTWATVRYAKKIGRPVLFIYP